MPPVDPVSFSMFPRWLTLSPPSNRWGIFLPIFSPLGALFGPLTATDFHRACKNLITMETLLSWHLFRIGWSYSLASKVMGQGRYWPPILWKPRWWVTLTMSIFFRNIQHLSAFFYCENRFIFFSLKEHQKCQLKLAAVRLWRAFTRH